MCELTLTSKAKRSLQRLDRNFQKQVRKKLKWLCENCHKPIHKPLKYNYKGCFKLRCRGCRVIYTYNKRTATIEVSRIEGRSSVYE